MAGERQPLLIRVETDNTENSGSSTNSVSPTTSPRPPIYGGIQHHINKIVPETDRITYIWNEVNVFAKRSTPAVDDNWQTIDLWSKFTSLVPKRGSRHYHSIQKHILKNSTGVALPGELLAIMGSSGAGKTTLLNALTFRSPPQVTLMGTRCINGVPVSSRSLTSQSAYVQQDDLFMGNLTVREHLIFQALVRMDSHMSYQRRMQRVDEVISELGLSKCEHTQIGVLTRTKGISGGERKRLSFAAEVLTDPKLMFCDEPTSGLDSFMALNVVQVLRLMALSGKTVICTIHQPSSEIFAMFDKLLLLAEGRTAFLGSPEEAGEFFRELEAPCPRNYNPADYYIQLLAVVPEREESCRQAVNLICDKYEKSRFGVRVQLEAATVFKEGCRDDDFYINGEGCRLSKSPYKASWCAQFRAVLWRSWLSVIKEPMLIKVRFLQTLIVAIITGLIYFGQNLDEDGVMNINGALFIFLTNMTFQNVFAVVNVFCAELPIFLREHRNGMYRTDVYFLCKNLAEAPVFIMIPVLFTCVAYYMIGLNQEQPRFFVACGLVTLVANAAISFGYLISCASSSVSMALSLGPPLIVPFLLFGGFFLNISSIPVYFQWLSYLSWFRFGNEGLMINQWRNVTEIECPVQNSTCPTSGHVVLEIYNFREEDFLMDLMILGGLIVGYRVAAFLALLFKTYR